MTCYQFTWPDKSSDDGYVIVIVTANSMEQAIRYCIEHLQATGRRDLVDRVRACGIVRHGPIVYSSVERRES